MWFTTMLCRLTEVLNELNSESFNWQPAKIPHPGNLPGMPGKKDRKSKWQSHAKSPASAKTEKAQNIWQANVWDFNLQC